MAESYKFSLNIGKIGGQLNLLFSLTLRNRNKEFCLQKLEQQTE